MASADPFARHARRTTPRKRHPAPPGDLPLVCPDHHTATDPDNRCDTCGTRWIGPYRERNRR